MSPRSLNAAAFAASFEESISRDCLLPANAVDVGFVDFTLDAESAVDPREDRVRAALQPDAFHMVYQPIVDLATREVVGFESLARFTIEPRRGPDVWFAEAWELGHGVELELAAVRRALEGLDSLPEVAFLTVNLAPHALVAPGLLAALGEGSLSRVVLEITEHAVVRDYSLLERALAPLRARGARLAVDDVGAGFASFQHILELRPDFIKLDVNLTRDLDLDPARRALVAALVSFSVEVGVTVLAEGIERRAEFVALRSLGVMLGQGYLLGRPAALSEGERRVGGERPSGVSLTRVTVERDPLETIGAKALRSLRDPARVAAVRATGLLDTPADAAFDRLTALASTLLTAPVALVSLIDDRRQFVKSAIGIEGTWGAEREVPLDESLCVHAVASRSALRVDDLRADARLHAYPGAEMRGARAYLGVPLLLAGRTPVGTLCVLDDVPRVWTTHEVTLLEQMAASVVAEITLRASLREVEETRRSLDRAQASAQQQLVAQEDGERRFRRLVESNPSAVWATVDGVVVDANRAAADLFGYERLAMIGLKEADLFPPVARDTWSTQLPGPDGDRYETLGLRGNGSVFSMVVRDQHVESGGRPVRVCAVLDGSVRPPRKTVPYLSPRP